MKDLSPIISNLLLIDEFDYFTQELDPVRLNAKEYNQVTIVGFTASMGAKNEQLNSEDPED